METHHLSTLSTPFVGREVESKEIARLLSESPCRLLTLVGPGGIGKTRLALEAIGQFSFPQGVYYVSLQPLTSPDFMLSSIAEVLGFQFYSGADPKQQLLDYLREKSLLLVLDNLEHLLDGVTLLSDMLTAAPQVRILATSRERLNLLEEWVLEVEGLGYPSTETETDLETYSAVNLFLHHARRAKVNFMLTDAQKPAVIQICRLVGGMPLALELSASWVRVLSCEQIVDEIERGLDILETGARNVEPRHRTVRATLDQSWQLLSDAERDVLMRLSVFRGGFTREAAESVAGASLRMLSALVDKSLLRANEQGRYDLQELVRQYTEEKLAELPAEREQVCERHCDYYANFMGQWIDDPDEINQPQTTEKILTDIDNVRTAYRWAVHRRKWHQVGKFLRTLTQFYDLQDRYQEGFETLRLAVDGLRDTPHKSEEQTKLIGFSLAWQSWYLQSLWRDHEARRLAEESLALLLPFGHGRELVYAYQFLTQLSYNNPLEMKRFAQASLKCSQAIDFRYGIWCASHLLSWALAKLGEYDEARQLLENALDICRKNNNHLGETWTLTHFAHVASCQQNFAESKQFLLQALAVAQTFNYRLAMANNHLSLGDYAQKSYCYDEAMFHYQESLRLAQEMGNQRHITLATEAIRLLETNQTKPEPVIPAQTEPVDNPLTERELEVLRLVAEGLSNREIAEQQVLAMSTVKWYINEIFSKLNVTTRIQAVARARTLGLLT
jgi:predicted ATPase/DNA-binding CsgD family transcriptional regulator